MNNTATNTAPCPTVRKQIGKTTYIVRVHFSQTAKETMEDNKKMGFMPAVEISYIKPKNQQLIAVSIEGEQSSPSHAQAKQLRELDQAGKLNGDVIDGILSQEKKEVDKVIINSAELEKYFGKDKSPREMRSEEHTSELQSPS